jgi:4-hydroxybenzoate polyprenyltransferase
VFALPFALIALLVATGGRPPVRLLAAVVAAMVLARSAAMAFNRFADRELDARNPRTAGREIPRGVISPRQALAFTILCSAGFVAVAATLGQLCLVLSIPVLAVLLGYSYAKRFTAAAHLWLGTALGLAPPAAHIAAVGRIDGGLWAPVLLGGAVAAWVAGFDVLYACQDEDFDRREGLFSLPARWGRARALLAARALHAAAVAGFVGFGWLAGSGTAYFVGVAVAASLLVVEHRLIRPDDLGRIRAAFFTLNGLVSVALLAFTLVDLYVV